MPRVFSPLTRSTETWLASDNGYYYLYCYRYQGSDSERIFKMGAKCCPIVRHSEKEVCLSWLANQLGRRVNGSDRHERRDRSQPNFAWNSANKIIKKSRSTFAHIDKSR